MHRRKAARDEGCNPVTRHPEWQIVAPANHTPPPRKMESPMLINPVRALPVLLLIIAALVVAVVLVHLAVGVWARR